MRILFFLLLFVTAANAQTCIGTPPLTQTTIDNTIDICLPTTNAQEISALALREVLKTMTAASFQNAVITNVSVIGFGAKCDGITDDTIAINNALASGSVNAVIPNATCYSATGITVPPGSSLSGSTWIGGSDPTLFTGGSRITCLQNLAGPCIRVGINGGAFSSSSISNLIVQGLGGGIPSSSIGIMVDGLLNVSLNQVMVHNFYQGYYWKSYNTAGLGGKMWQAYSGRIKDAHIVIDSWPEMQISQSRFGVDGTSDIGANTYVRFQQVAHVNGAGAANTFDCMNCQFNEGHGGFPVNHWVEFVDCLAGPPCFPTDDVEIFRFTNNHIENVNYGIYSDSSWNIIQDFKLTSSSLIVFTDLFSQINAATTLLDFGITASRTLGAGNLTLTTNSNGIKFTGSYFESAITVTGSGSGSRLIATGNTFILGMTVNGANWLSVNLTGNEGGTTISQSTSVTSGTIIQMDNANRQIIGGFRPSLTITDKEPAANTRNWDFFSQNGTINLRAVNDAYNATTTPFSCTRILAVSTGCNIQFPASITGAGTQTFTNSPCSGLTTAQWIPITISGQTGTWYIAACQ